VWWHNTYPGCEVDVPSLAYSFSFIDYPWASTHASQQELQEYAEHVIDHFSLRGHFNFGTGVEKVRWIDDRSMWELTTEGGEVAEFDVVVSCLGMLSQPNIPDWASGEFTGPVFHTANYRHDIDLSGKCVALVGTGSTACQLAPQIVRTVDRLDLYQREPGHVMPKKVHRYTEDELAGRKRRSKLGKKLDRYRAFRDHGRFQGAFNSKTRKQQELWNFARSYVARNVADPELRDQLIPAYPYGCKRPVFASGYYKIFSQPNVELVPTAVTRLSRTGVVDADGKERPADVVILATGFRATEYQKSITLLGPGERDLQTIWRGEPSAFLGITVPSFPNFFMVYGPNTNGGTSIIASLERQAEVIARAVKRLSRDKATVIDTRPQAAAIYDRWIQRRLTRRSDVFEAACHNYYHSSSGKNVTQLPMSATTYLFATRLLSRLGWSFRSMRSTPEPAFAGSATASKVGSREGA
jgi:cation diffusion facilitator CzcD-associated flavoprotein CzcO